MAHIITWAWADPFVIGAISFVGRTTVGTLEASPTPDVVISGTGIEKEHCYIENQDGVIMLVPIARHCMVDGVAVTMATKLTQGKNS